jgi:site-specific DNA-methyltransferase (adenine-specific)
MGPTSTLPKPRRPRTPLHPSVPAARWTANILGDHQPFDPTPWLGYPQVILWGAEHYRTPAAQGWIVWEKRDGSTPDDHAGCELAWSNVPGSSQVHWHKWRGIIRAGEANVANRPKFHPAEKPIELMLKCVQATTGTVLDPYMGSGTTGEACLRLGRPFVGIELDPHFFQVACARLAAAARQLQLFPPPPCPQRERLDR